MFITKTYNKLNLKLNEKIYLLLFKKIIYSMLFAVLTGIFSRIRFFLPFTPVPITGQVFMVLLSGIILGSEFGAFSQMIYVFMGIAGIPWFALGSLFSPTGGYLIGFIIAPYIVGIISRKRTSLIPIALSIGLFIIYLFGAIQFSLIIRTDFIQTIKLTVLPFIPFDILKSGLIILIISFYKKVIRYT